MTNSELHSQKLPDRLKRIRQALFGSIQVEQQVSTPTEIDPSSIDVDPSGVDTVCLALGPYRNLSTFTASLLAFHPNCQVMNHGGDKILTDPNVNFLQDYSADKLTNFIQYAIVASTGGTQGDSGGSITYSHAFENPQVRDAYREMFGQNLVKHQITSLFWKESLRTANFLRTHEIDVTNILKQDQRLRFLMPVRNPMDCAISNHSRAQKIVLFEGLTVTSSLEDVLLAVLREFKWYLTQRKHKPDRFFHYYEHSYGREVVESLAQFLMLPTSSEWLDTVEQHFTINKSYEHDQDLRQLYQRLILAEFQEFPEEQRDLLKFT